MKIGNPPPPKQAAPPSSAPAPAAATQAPAAAPGWAPKAERAAPVAPPAAASKSPGEVATAFYKAFTTGDLATMKDLYAPDVKFKDTLFEYCDREGTMHMWKKLDVGGPAGKFEYQLDRVEGDKAYGHWNADYKVGGRPVHNEIKSELTIRDGKIVKHTDDWDWKKWAPQALPLGPLVNAPGVKWLLTKVFRGVIGMD